MFFFPFLSPFRWPFISFYPFLCWLQITWLLAQFCANSINFVPNIHRYLLFVTYKNIIIILWINLPFTMFGFSLIWLNWVEVEKWNGAQILLPVPNLFAGCNHWSSVLKNNRIWMIFCFASLRLASSCMLYSALSLVEWERLLMSPTSWSWLLDVWVFFR